MYPISVVPWNIYRHTHKHTQTLKQHSHSSYIQSQAGLLRLMVIIISYIKHIYSYNNLNINSLILEIKCQVDISQDSLILDDID